MIRAVVLLSVINDDETFARLSVEARLVFVLLLPELDREGNFRASRGLTVAQTLAVRLHLPDAAVEKSLAELLRLRFIAADPFRLVVLRFVKHQAAGLRILMEQQAGAQPAAPSTAAHGPKRAAVPPMVTPRRGGGRVAHRPDDGRLKHPAVEGESPEERRLRRRREAQQARRDGMKPLQVEAPVGLKPLQVEAQSGFEAASSPALEGLHLRAGSDSPSVLSVENESPTGSLSPSEALSSQERREGASAFEGASDETASGGRSYALEGASPGPSRPVGEAGSVAQGILQRLLTATRGIFRIACAPAVMVEFANVEARMDEAGFPADRWEILGAFILANGFHRLREERFRRGDLVVPDLRYFFVPRQGEDPRSGARKTEMDSSLLVSGMEAALNWNENGRPKIGKSGVAKVRVGSAEEMGRAARDAQAAGGSGSERVVSMDAKSFWSEET